MKKLFLLCALLSAPVYGMEDFGDGDDDFERELWMHFTQAHTRDVHGRTPLMVAAGSHESGILESMRMLLGHKAGIDLYDNHNQTALHKAVQEGHAEKIALLFAHGASIDIIDRAGSKPIDCAHAHGIEIRGLLRSAEVSHSIVSLLRLFL